MKKIFIVLQIVFIIIVPMTITEALDDACKFWHSCPSDSADYVCGDLGHCDQCPDNRYCKNGKKRSSPYQSSESDEEGPDFQEFSYCTRVIKGDIIIIRTEGTDERFRLIGVEAPDMDYPPKPANYFEREAYAFTKELVEGKKVRLEYDEKKRDRYKRLLAYVYLEDGALLNAEIIKNGYGVTDEQYPFKHLDEFRQYEDEAKAKKRGLWSNKYFHPNTADEQSTNQ